MRAIADFLYPRGGWTRAFHYVKHRVRRLPDTPERIARGIWAGVFTTFSPLYGLHFFIAAFIAWLLRGNIFAALLATFFGNPLTYVPIGVVSLQTGYTLLGIDHNEGVHRSFGGKFVDAWGDLKNNFLAMFTDRDADWSGIAIFYDEIFFPYFVGGLIPGVLSASIAYYISLPLIRAYKKRRKGAIKAKFDEIRRKAEARSKQEQKVE